MTDQEIKAERLRILDETAKFYNSNNRSIYQIGSCVYKTDDNKRCAIGRLLTDEEVDAIISQNLNFDGVYTLNSYNLIPEKLLFLGIAFLSNLQGLHDGAIYWNESGLSDDGLNQYQIIKGKYC